MIMKNICNINNINTPQVTVLLPVYNSEKYLDVCIQSIINQTFKNWELLIVIEKNSSELSKNIVRNYSEQDSRIRTITNKGEKGLAGALNYGIVNARGNLIARIDADDIARIDRLEKEKKFLDEHSDIWVCGSYQHHFGETVDWIHRPAIDPEQCKANLLFFCDLCHSTVMFRKDKLEEYNLKYDSIYLAEDFELWTRIVSVGKIANIPEVLGEYRWGNDNITINKIVDLHQESGRIVSNNLKENLDINLTEYEIMLFCNWKNPFFEEKNRLYRNNMLQQLEYILRKIYLVNETKKYYDSKCLLNAIAVKWRWAKFGVPYYYSYNIDSIDQVFTTNIKFIHFKKFYWFLKNNGSIKVKIKKIISFFYKKF